jgi:arginyl-tRNA synthetase
MINLAEQLAEDIRLGLEAAQKAGDLPKIKELPAIEVKPADDVSHGDYASPVALLLSKSAKMAPLKIVEAIVKHMEKKEYMGKIEAAAPGFLNMWINPGWLTARLDNIIEQDLCSDMKLGSGRSANLEFISANPTGPMTLGNVRTAFSADTLANVLECVGYNVTREYYINDAGGQIKKLGESVLRRILQARGEAVEFAEDLYQGSYILDVAKQVAERLKEDEAKEYTAEDLEDAAVIQKVSIEAKDIILGWIKRTISDDLKINFNSWISEQYLRDSGLVEKTLEKIRATGKTYKKEGAEYLKTTEHGDDQDRVVVKKNGEYAYITPDIAYHQYKYDRGFDFIFTFLGADHQGHIPKVKAAMDILGNDLGKLRFLVGQWVRFIRGGQPVGLSKRKGEIFTPKELIDEVGYDAARFFMVQHSLSSHMDFDLDLAKERSERNPVYYIQYAYVRLQSILRRAKEEGALNPVSETAALSSRPALTHTYELALMRLMYRFPEVLTSIANSYSVHQLPYYAQELAAAVHVFYKNVPVLSVEDEEMRRSRLELVSAASKVLGKVLDILGVNKPDVM